MDGAFPITGPRPLALLLALAAAGCGAPEVRQETVVTARDQLPGTPEESLVRMGDSMRASGDLNGAAQFYGAAVSRNGKDAAALVKLGDTELALSDPARAEQAFRAALAASPGTRDASVGLGVALLSRGDAAGALAVLEPVARSSRDPRALRNYGVALDLLGRQVDAQAAYRRGLESAPADPDLHANLALSLAVSGDLSGAQQEIDTAVNLPNAPERARVNQVVLLAMAGRTAEAESAGRQLADGGGATALIERGERAREANDPAGRAAALGLVTARPS